MGNLKDSINSWLPTTKKEVEARGWTELDVIIFSGDAYVDHPSFGAAVIGRVLEKEGYRVAIVPQPNWQDDGRDFIKLGKPRLFFGVSAGSMDSMVNHYTARRRRRSDDAYTPGGKAGFRPDYPTIVYSKILRKFFPESIIAIGGIEASLRRLTHYDYWQNKLKPSILCESGADILMYGMGEHSIVELAKTIENGAVSREDISEACANLKQISYLFNGSAAEAAAAQLAHAAASALPAASMPPAPAAPASGSCAAPAPQAPAPQAPAVPPSPAPIILHSHQECLASKLKQAENFAKIETASNMQYPPILLQEVSAEIVNCGANSATPPPHGSAAAIPAAKAANQAAVQAPAHGKTPTPKTIVVNPPYPSDAYKIDEAFDLPFTRLPHPKYKNRGEIPAYTMIRHSINIHRGCFGGCAFCTISAHQGKQVLSRSEESILRELEQLVEMEDFKGYISDLGGPSANMYKMEGKNKEMCALCKRPSCIFPNICKNLNADHKPLLNLFKKVSKHKKVKKCFIGSGIRYDLLVPFLKNNQNSARDYAKEIIINGVSGRLKVAPEHTQDNVLQTMRKMPFSQFKDFKKFFDLVCKEANLRQQLIPYFISAHPNCSLQDMQALSKQTKSMGYKLEQVQLFTPTPMTLATEMYYTGYDPHSLKKIFVEKDPVRRDRQNNCFFA